MPPRFGRGARKRDMDGTKPFTDQAIGPSPVATTAAATPARKFAVGLALALTLAALGAVAFFGTPFLFWAWHIHRAGSFMEQGLVWPDPHYSDSLPTPINALALGRALDQLDRAQDWRPRHFHAYRVRARIFMALGQWIEAEQAIARARQRAPLNPLVQFDGVLIYERMMAVLARDAAPLLWPRIAASPDSLTAPAFNAICQHPVDLTACDYLYADITLPVAGLATDALTWTAPFLGIRGSQSVEIALTLPFDVEALSYIAAVLPENAGPLPEQAPLTLQIRAEGAADFATISQRHFTAGDSQKGWMPGFASLAPWAGQRVHLRFQASSRAHHMGWGQLALAQAETGAIMARIPQVRWQEALLAGNFRSSDMMALAAEAQNRGQEERSQAWARRAAFLQAEGR